MDLGVLYIDKVFFYTVLIVLAITIIISLVMYCVIKKGVKDALREYEIFYNVELREQLRNDITFSIISSYKQLNDENTKEEPSNN